MLPWPHVHPEPRDDEQAEERTGSLLPAKRTGPHKQQFLRWCSHQQVRPFLPSRTSIRPIGTKMAKAVVMWQRCMMYAGFLADVRYMFLRSPCHNPGPGDYYVEQDRKGHKVEPGQHMPSHSFGRSSFQHPEVRMSAWLLEFFPYSLAVDDSFAPWEAFAHL